MAIVICSVCHKSVDDGPLFCPVCDSVLRPAAPESESASQPKLRLVFGFGDIEIEAGCEETLGRDPETCPGAERFAPHDNVSRVHATIRVDNTGIAYVTDLGSMNGTFLSGSELRPNAEQRLREGDELRLASDVPAKVKYINEGLRTDVDVGGP